MATSMVSKIIGRPTWQQAMLRISNPSKSIPFYTDVMGMTVIDTLDFPQWEFKLFFLTTLPKDMEYKLTPGTQEAHVCFMENILFICCDLFYSFILILFDFPFYTSKGLHVVH